MATIHMDTGEAANTNARMRQAHSTITSELSTTQSTVNGLVGGGWIANSANEFQSEFEVVARNLQICLEQMDTLSARLDREIQEWEQMQQTLA